MMHSVVFCQLPNGTAFLILFPPCQVNLGFACLFCEELKKLPNQEDLLPYTAWERGGVPFAHSLPLTQLCMEHSRQGKQKPGGKLTRGSASLSPGEYRGTEQGWKRSFIESGLQTSIFQIQ